MTGHTEWPPNRLHLNDADTRVTSCHEKEPHLKVSRNNGLLLVFSLKMIESRGFRWGAWQWNVQRCGFAEVPSFIPLHYQSVSITSQHQAPSWFFTLWLLSPSSATPGVWLLATVLCPWLLTWTPGKRQGIRNLAPHSSAQLSSLAIL